MRTLFDFVAAIPAALGTGLSATIIAVELLGLVAAFIWVRRH